MKNNKSEKIFREEQLEKKIQKLKNASVVDEITVEVPVDEPIKKSKRGSKENKKQKEQDEFMAYNSNTGKEVKRKKHKKKKHTVLKVFLGIIIIVVTFFGYKLIKGMNENGWTIGGFVATMLGHDSNTLAKLPRMNILLIGQSQNLTDTLLICSYDPKIQDAVLFSIPRDTFVGRNRNKVSSYDKINAIYQTDPELLMEKVRGITGLDLQYYVKVDTKGLRELVDSIGGVYFYVPIDMDYDDCTQDLAIHLKQGYQLLDGDKAEQAVRFRHNNDGTTYPADYGEQDIGRMRTQREFLTVVLKQLAKPENITKVDDYIKIANNNVETNFSIWNLKDYAPYLLDFKTEDIKTATLPGAPEKIGGLWFYSYDKKKTKELVNELFEIGQTEEQEENAKITVKILNGTSDSKNLANLQNLLKESGYTVESTGTTSLTKTTTIINRTNQSDKIANKLQQTIGVGIIADSTKDNNSKVDFTIIIGDDYN